MKPINTTEVCDRKVKHPTKRAAEYAARLLRAHGAQGVATYKCTCCKRWHTGSRIRWR